MELAKHALKLNAVTFSPDNPYTWASGYKMPIYNDNRLLLSDPAIRKLVVSELVKLLQVNNIKADCIGGVPTAGLPWAASLADALFLPLIYVRDEPKKHGLQKQIEGKIEPGMEVVLVEDVISTGGSAAKAVPVVREAGAKCSTVLGIFSYGFKEATDKFDSVGAKIYSALTYQDLLTAAIETGYVSKENLKTLEEWQKSPFTWGMGR